MRSRATSDRSPPLLNLVMIGPLPPPYGGVTVYFDILTEEVQQQGATNLRIVDTLEVTRVSAPMKIRVLLRLLLLPFTGGRDRPDVITLHMSIGALSIFGPWLTFAGRLRRIPVIVHRFGGDLISNEKGWRALLLKTTYRLSSAALIETRAQHMELSDLRRPMLWFPNIRKKPDIPIPERKQCRKFLFLSQVFPEKGVGELLESFKRLHEQFPDSRLDIYGPIPAARFTSDDACYSAEDFRHPGVRYLGLVKPDRVYETIGKHDVLVLPTWFSGEGYPGVIIEAYQMGAPVIATNWQSIPDIVDNTSGLLVEPKDPTSLYRAMKQLYCDEHLYRRLVEGACKKANEFDATIATEKFIELCKELAKQPGNSDD